MASSDRKARPDQPAAASRATTTAQGRGEAESREAGPGLNFDDERGSGQGGRAPVGAGNGGRERESSERDGGRQGQWMQPARHSEWGPAMSAGERLGWPSMWAENPFSLMRAISRDVDRMFEQFWESGLGLARAANPTSSAWIPRVDVCERNDELLVRADLPGIDREDIRVEVEDDAITIRGERRGERDEAEGGFQRSERFHGSFFRRIPLPEAVDVDQARAHMRDGVLEVRLPATGRHRGRRLQIESAEPGEARPGAGEAGQRGSRDGESFPEGESPRRAERQSGQPM